MNSLHKDSLLGRAAAAVSVRPAFLAALGSAIASLLLSSERHRRITQAESQAYLALLQRLPISTDVSAAERGRLDIFHLAREHGLTVFDATYLDLAMRRQLPLATLDHDLQRAARATGVSLIQL